MQERLNFGPRQRLQRAHLHTQRVQERHEPFPIPRLELVARHLPRQTPNGLVGELFHLDFFTLAIMASKSRDHFATVFAGPTSLKK